MKNEFKQYGEITFHLKNIKNIFNYIEILMYLQKDFLKIENTKYFFKIYIEKYADYFFNRDDGFFKNFEELNEVEKVKLKILIEDALKQNELTYILFYNDKNLKNYIALNELFLKILKVRYLIWEKKLKLLKSIDNLLKYINLKNEYYTKLENFEDYLKTIFSKQRIMNFNEIEKIKKFDEEILNYFYNCGELNDLEYEKILENLKIIYNDKIITNKLHYSLGLFYLIYNINLLINEFNDFIINLRNKELINIYFLKYSNKNTYNLIKNILKINVFYDDDLQKIYDREFPLISLLNKTYILFFKKLKKEFTFETFLDKKIINEIDKLIKKLSEVEVNLRLKSSTQLLKKIKENIIIISNSLKIKNPSNEERIRIIKYLLSKNPDLKVEGILNSKNLSIKEKSEIIKLKKFKEVKKIEKIQLNEKEILKIPKVLKEDLNIEIFPNLSNKNLKKSIQELKIPIIEKILGKKEKEIIKIIDLNFPNIDLTKYCNIFNDLKYNFNIDISYKIPKINFDIDLLDYSLKIKIELFHLLILNLKNIFNQLGNCLNSFAFDYVNINNNFELLKNYFKENINEEIKNYIVNEIKNIIEDIKKLKNKKLIEITITNLEDFENLLNIDFSNEIQNLKNLNDLDNTNDENLTKDLNSKFNDLKNKISNNIQINDFLPNDNSKENFPLIDLKNSENIQNPELLIEIEEILKIDENPIKNFLEDIEILKSISIKNNSINEIDKLKNFYKEFICNLNKLSCELGKIRNILNGHYFSQISLEIENALRNIPSQIKTEIDNLINTEILNPLNEELNKIGLTIPKSFSCDVIKRTLIESLKTNLNEAINKALSPFVEMEYNFKNCNINPPSLGLNIDFDLNLELNLSNLIGDILPEFKFTLPSCD